MSNILAKEGNIAGISHNSRKWSKASNIIDYDIVFLNLNSIIRNKDKLATPDSNIPISLEFPEPKDVKQFLFLDKSLFVILPKKRYVNLKRIIENEKNEKKIDLLSWMPFSIETREKTKNKREKTIENIHPNWDWYFKKDFKWHMYIKSIGIEKNLFRENSPKSKNIKIETLASTVSKKDIATKISLYNMSKELSKDININVNNKKRNKNTDSSYSGNIYLIPLRRDIKFRNLGASILSEIFNLDIEGYKENSPPNWLDKYPLKKETENKKSDSKLKSGGQKILGYTVKKYKRDLLFSKDPKKVVLDTLRNLGFKIETKNEKSKKKDIILHLNEHLFALKIYATTGKVTSKKCRELKRLVEETQKKYPKKSVSGLFIVNTNRDRDPEKRKEPVVGQPKRILINNKFKLITTYELYNILIKYKKGRMEYKKIKDMLLEDSLRININ